MQLLVGGEFTLMFFGFVVILGLIIPAILEFSELIGLKVPAYVPAILVILGGFVFRFVMVEAGQITRYLILKLINYENRKSKKHMYWNPLFWRISFGNYHPFYFLHYRKRS